MESLLSYVITSISSDTDFLPEYALKKKVRWCMNSKQGSRYIKRRIGDDLKSTNFNEKWNYF